MANRAYLFSANQTNLRKSEFTELPYYDSRHIIPILWFLFFNPNSVNSVTVEYVDSSWQEPRLFTHKDLAVTNFVERLPLVEEYFANRFQHRFNVDYNKFIDDIKSWSGDFLILEPNEVVEDDEATQHFIQALQTLGSGNTEQFINNLQNYTGSLNRVMDDRDIVNFLIGFTY